MYLTEDITGLASRIVYGRKGDKIKVINERDGMYLVENNGERFHVWPDKLSESEIQKEDTPEVIEKEVQRGKGRKKTSKPITQNDLFK